MIKYLLCLLVLVPAFGVAQLTAKPIQPGRGVGFYEFLPQGYDPNSTSKYPLIINMHGDGEKGNGTTELTRVLQWGLGEMVDRQHATLKFNFNGKQTSFIALFPQLDTSFRDWMEFQVDSMINYAINNLNVDVNKIFLTGYSLGGGGAWRYPAFSVANARKIAGIFPVSGSPGYTGFDLCNIAAGQTAVWVLHSVDDDSVPFEFAKAGVDGVNACSPDMPAVTTYYPSGAHNQAWLWALDTTTARQYPSMWEWMAGTTRLNTKANNQDPVANAGTDITVAMPATATTLNGSASNDPNDVIVKYEWTKTAGPAAFTIEKPTYPTTNLSNLQFGTYTFQLKVTDEFGIVKTDEVTVNVTSALPVGISSFKGKMSGKFNNLNWSTATEINLDRFEIQRSADGINFNMIGSFAAGRSSYAFVDEKAPAGISYYRLRNVDKSGAFSYSDIISIDNNSPAIVLTKYPNPVLNELNLMVQGAVFGKLEVTIHDLDGRLVKKLTVNKTDISWKGVINTVNLQKGVYTLQVQKPGSMKEVSSFVKK